MTSSINIKSFLLTVAMGMTAALTIATAAHAGTPLWTFTPVTETTLEVPDTGTATVTYTVHNQSRKAKNLVLFPTPGITQSSACILSPKGQANDTCHSPYALKVA